jgi:hypothetical protein
MIGQASVSNGLPSIFVTPKREYYAENQNDGNTDARKETGKGE